MWRECDCIKAGADRAPLAARRGLDIPRILDQNKSDSENRLFRDSEHWDRITIEENCDGTLRVHTLLRNGWAWKQATGTAMPNSPGSRWAPIEHRSSTACRSTMQEFIEQDKTKTSFLSNKLPLFNWLQQTSPSKTSKASVENVYPAGEWYCVRDDRHDVRPQFKAEEIGSSHILFKWYNLEWCTSLLIWEKLAIGSLFLIQLWRQWGNYHFSIQCDNLYRLIENKPVIVQMMELCQGPCGLI